jgi:hypothetical protein
VLGTQYEGATRSGIVAIDPATVVSPEQVRPYKTLPGTFGLRELIQSGALVGPDSPQFKDAYDAWNEAASKPYRSHLDPDFLLSYKVDYLVTRPVQLPANLPKMTFLEADKVDTPDLAGSRQACLFFADQRKLAIDRRKQRDPRCDSFTLLRSTVVATPERDPTLALVQWSLEQMKVQSEAVREACKETLVDADAYLAGLALYEDPILDWVQRRLSRAGSMSG